MKQLLGILFFIVPQFSNAQIPVSEVRISCSSEYFKEHDFQHVLFVRGLWCQDVYFWSMIDIADTLDQLAYHKDSLFSGVAIDYNLNEQLIGKYSFEKGLITHIQEYDTTGLLWREFNFSAGIPHGTHTVYNERGEVHTLLTFNHGMLSGPFQRTRDFYDYGLGECLEKGMYIDGVEHLETKPCTVE